MPNDTVDMILAQWEKELPGFVGVELELGKRAARLSAMLTERVSGELSRMGLAKGEYEVLAVLRAAGTPYQLRPSELAQRLMLSSGGTSNLLRRLTDTGLIEREANPADARSSWVRLTPRGKDLAEKAVKAAGRTQLALLQAVPQHDLETAIHALRRILVALGDVPLDTASTPAGSDRDD
jgi:DNA-binding MarR family transcriptional regulator